MSNTNGIEVVYARRTIEITKGFEKKARKYTSSEYEILRKVRNDNPTFRIVIKTSSAKNNANKGLTFEHMNQYISYFMPELMDEYLILCGKKANEKGEIPPAKSIPEIQKWFRKKRDAFENEQVA